LVFEVDAEGGADEGAERDDGEDHARDEVES